MWKSRSDSCVRKRGEKSDATEHARATQPPGHPSTAQLQPAHQAQPTLSASLPTVSENAIQNQPHKCITGAQSGIGAGRGSMKTA